uniref:Protein Vpu n=1 Tax=Human immunodeficiency virus type 1 TaxID=11676 RepID=I6REY1_HV1|nr:vpu protein [Human immunodeficiency virus 1]AFM44041.1 vpu protein [Human immunodeficiency virus 1]ALP12864.1 vpu protein [Human immunodeficiency virus 1]
MHSSIILTIVAFVVAIILTIVAFVVIIIEYRKIRRQRKIDRLLDRIIERAEDSGNESDGDQEELSAILEMGHLAPWVINDE